MKPRHKRLIAILGGLAALGAATALVLTAFQENLVFFFTPSQVAANEAPQGRTFRIGGMVEKGSVKRDGVDERHDALDQGHDQREAQRELSELRDHLVCSVFCAFSTAWAASGGM